ncbi:MAG: chromate efflux transporter [Pyrinomonadaceae bacterium]|nr:chromate efflux transporter [Pyrinomonadaceae bacterium]
MTTENKPVVGEPCGAIAVPFSSARSARRSVSFGEAFRFWFKLGFISFGGPAGQIAIMHRELVERRRWISEERFLHALNFCMLLPGPEAQQLAIYIGWLMHRVWGGIVAGAFFVIPSIFVLLALSYTYAAYGNAPAVAGVLSGFKPVVVAIVVEAVLKIGGRALKRRAHFLIATAAFVAIYFINVPFPLIILAAGLVGLAGARFWPEAFNAAPAKTKEAYAKTEGDGQVTGGLPLAIDDYAPPPAHTVPSRVHLIRTLAVGLALWVLPLVVLILWRGWGSLHAQEYRFFTQAALVTFGGAYAVLAYVTQAAVGSYGWLTHAQAVDGLALAETTPGPLIMVLQFIGFMAAWNNAQGMDQTASAITGALVTTYATFLPCFIFIFLGAPLPDFARLESKQPQLRYFKIWHPSGERKRTLSKFVLLDHGFRRLAKHSGSVPTTGRHKYLKWLDLRQTLGVVIPSPEYSRSQARESNPP